MADYPQETWKSREGYPHHFQMYSSQGEPKGLLVLVHGIQSHSGWYDSSCRFLAQAGYHVYFFNRRGSGKNSIARGDSPSFRTLLADLSGFVQWVRQQHEGRPLFLGGISWGGKPVMGLEILQPGLVDGFLFLCPGFCPIVGPSLKQRLQIALARFCCPKTLFPIPLSDPELFTQSNSGKEFIRTDPFALRQATARFLFDSARLDLYLRLFINPIKKPVLLLLAEKDRIIDNEKTLRFLTKFAPNTLQSHLYQGASHTLEFEPEPRQYLNDIVAWLNSLG